MKPKKPILFKSQQEQKVDPVEARYRNDYFQLCAQVGERVYQIFQMTDAIRELQKAFNAVQESKKTNGGRHA